MEFIVSLAIKFWQWTILVAVVIIGAIINFLDKKKKSNLTKREKKYCSCLMKVRATLKKSNPRSPYAICTTSLYNAQNLKRTKRIDCSKNYNFNSSKEKGKPVNKNFEYNSKNNKHFLSVNEIKKYLKSNK